MTAIPLLKNDGGFAVRDPVRAITDRIERARSRLKLERAAPPAYAVFDEGHLVGAIHAPNGTPVFGPAAPTVLLQRAVARFTGRPRSSPSAPPAPAAPSP